MENYLTVSAERHREPSNEILTSDMDVALRCECFRRDCIASCGAAVVWNDLLTSEMLREIALFSQDFQNARISQQFMALNGYTFPFIERSKVTSEKTENVISKAGKSAPSLAGERNSSCMDLLA